mgnify:CR=1 FL=1
MIDDYDTRAEPRFDKREHYLRRAEHAEAFAARVEELPLQYRYMLPLDCVAVTSRLDALPARTVVITWVYVESLMPASARLVPWQLTQSDWRIALMSWV